YAQKSQIKDSLIVYLSYDCGATWNRILSAGPNNTNPNIFSTHAPMIDAFYPQNADDWCGGSYGTPCYSLDLSPWAGLTSVKLMFESYGRHGNNIFLDNIQISGPAGIPEKSSGDLGVKIYPNPSSGIFTLQINKTSQPIGLSMVDLQGKEVFKDFVEAHQSGIIRMINLKELSKGIYYLRLTSNETTQVEKVVIE
ncbi:MAG: T9SS type A sorting domain-containing protein, partial [Bacteroidota bacterium]